MPLPAFLNGLISDKPSNLAPNIFKDSGIKQGNQQTGPNLSAVSPVLNFGSNGILSGIFANTPSTDKSNTGTSGGSQNTTQNNGQDTTGNQNTQQTYDQAIRSGSMMNPLYQYNPQFGQDYADANMGGYNPMAEFQNLKDEQRMNAARHEGPYALPEGVPTSMEDLQRINSMGDAYYANKFARVSGEGASMKQNLTQGMPGGMLGTLPSAVAGAVQKHAEDFSNQKPVQAMVSLSNTLANAKEIYDSNKDNPGLADGTSDYRMMFLLANAMNPNSQVSEGDYKNAQDIMGTFPAQVQSMLSQYIMTNPDGSLNMSDKKKGFLTPEGRRVIYQSIQDHYNSGLPTYNALRNTYAQQIDKDTGRSGFGAQYLPNFAGGAYNTGEQQQQKPSSSTQPAASMGNAKFFKDPATGKWTYSQ